MKKLLFLVTLFFAVQFAVTAQDEAIYTHYHIDQSLINPAANGFKTVHRIQLNYRDSWTGFPDAPKTYAFRYNGPIGKTFGFGAAVRSEKLASLNRFRVNLAYAFKYNINKFKFAGGFSTEFQQIRLNNAAFSKPSLFEGGDPLLDNLRDGDMIFDAAFGFYGEYNEATFFGLSFPNLVRAKLDDIVDPTVGGSFLEYYLFSFGHRFVTNENFTLVPSMLIKKVRDVPFQVDFNLRGDFLQEKLVAGVTYRTGTGGTLGLLLGTKISALRLYYSYDVYLEKFQRYNTGSHEVTLSFEFDPSKKDRAAKFR